MLGKLMKHEWIATRRILLPVNLTILLITFIGCIFLGTDLLQSENSVPLTVLLILLYAFSMIAISLVSSIYLLIRFYRNLFTAEGYLMFTLPVTPVQLLNSKLLVAYLWSIFNTLLTLASIFFLGFSSGYYSAVHGDSNSKGAFLSGLTDALSGGASSSASFQDIFGYTPAGMAGMCIVSLLLGAFFSLTMGYLAISLGQLIEEHKAACSIGFYIALYIGVQMISSMLLVVINISTLTGDSLSLPELTGNIYRTVFPASGVLNLTLGILFYIITFFIIRKKVNLD